MAGESNRMSFGFFIVAALDLLGCLETVITSEERQSWIEWIYVCQVPHTGGFRGFTGTSLAGLRSPHNWHWDPANLPNTYFALATLLILGDDLARVRRQECLAWVRQLQLPNGSFGELLGEDNQIQGGSDPRLCMCATGIIRILMGKEEQGRESGISQIKLQQYLADCQVSHLYVLLRGQITLVDSSDRARREGSPKHHCLKHIVSCKGFSNRELHF